MERSFELEKETKILILIVLYNKTITTSETINSLIISAELLESCEILIWDNSPKPVLSKDNLQFLSGYFKVQDYICTTDNLPLSKIYNQVIKNHLDPIKHNYLMLLDHDSKFDKELFLKLFQATSAYPHVQLFLPIVYTGTTIVSPANIFLFKGDYWREKHLGLVPSKNKSAINSGMVISSDYLKCMFQGYDEKLKFYGTDTYFMEEFAKQQKEFCVFDGEIKHTLDFYEDEPLDKKLSRFKEIRRSIIILYSSNFLKRGLAYLYISYLSAYYAYRIKSFRFIIDYKKG